jgi:dolichyl-phosphate-mannose--protein O-mannosyl transferase
MASFNLGLKEIPSSGWRLSGNAQFYVDLGSLHEVKELMFMVKTGDLNVEIFTGNPDSWDPPVRASIEGFNRWRRIEIDHPTRYLRIEFGQSYGEILEMIVIENGYPIEILSVYGEDKKQEFFNSLVDEQELSQFPPTYMSESIFDEVYYVRAAEDYLSGRDPYESTHPPLGKLIIAGGISILGNNPFGWRFAGVLFATLMIPVVFFLGKEISGSWQGGVFSALLLVFDFMHFTMSRMATTETFLVFFTMTSQLFFYKYMVSVLDDGWSAPIWYLCAAVFFASLGFSTKWTSAFNLIAQFFILGLLRFGFFKEGYKDQEIINKNVIITVVGTAAIFILFYFLTYIPYLSLGHSLRDVYDRQWSMLNYHAGLEASHDFSSSWWTWPLITKPVWLYFSDLGGDKVSTISAFGNPVIWWGGFIAIIMLFERVLRKKNPTDIFLLTLFTFQWLPYALFSRVLFIYHFYPNIPILCVTITNHFFPSYVTKKRKKTWYIYLVGAALVFFIFYPIISGIPVQTWWRNMLRWFGSWWF